MPTAIPRSSTSRSLDSERAYFGELEGVPRFERDQETELARAVVGTRRAYWTTLVSPTHLRTAIAAIVRHASDEEVRRLARDVRGLLDRDAGDGPESAVAALVDALVKAGDQHAAADAVVAVAAGVDARWHADAVEARAVFLAARNRFVRA
ncbi:MAG TPA: hypothetical protein VFG69_17830, partial [Nannocystaceae bacterium]|nr:hypothetical protein [Nannocystaceae bacterium]